jgi:Asp-tRNA(Asn)/Glu-tRNA(Gln) amidotransferase A subunit family amidase
MSDHELCYMSATEALALFRGRSLSPVELTAAVIERAEAVAATVNPFGDRYFDQAMTRARAAEAKYSRPGGRPRRLEGIPWRSRIRRRCAASARPTAH